MGEFEDIKAASLRNLDMQIVRAQRAKAAVEAATTPHELWLAVPHSRELYTQEYDISTTAWDLRYRQIIGEL